MDKNDFVLISGWTYFRCFHNNADSGAHIRIQTINKVSQSPANISEKFKGRPTASGSYLTGVTARSLEFVLHLVGWMFELESCFKSHRAVTGFPFVNSKIRGLHLITRRLDSLSDRKCNMFSFEMWKRKRGSTLGYFRQSEGFHFCNG